MQVRRVTIAICAGRPAGRVRAADGGQPVERVVSKRLRVLGGGEGASRQAPATARGASGTGPDQTILLVVVVAKTASQYLPTPRSTLLTACNPFMLDR